MAIYNISYDLSAPGRDYKDLYTEIKSLGPWARPVESTWLIESSLTATEVKDRLKAKMDSNDKVLVMEYGNDYAWRNMSKEVGEWIKKRM